ncbi:MAG: aminotransferase class V-fold PLP-dependent enzyme [Bacteroidales bacterium]|nr:aminotransferase class V-fold PLP-dependent enzyme [Bacteroidales bacterium]
MYSPSQIRDNFDFASRTVAGRPLVYFDNAATSQRPRCVLDLQDELCRRHNANIHRAVHTLSYEATDYYEKGRVAAQIFLNAASPDEIVLTSGATAAINLVAQCMVRGGFIGRGDGILITEAEHHSNLVPWQMVCGQVGAHLEVVPVRAGKGTANDGAIDMDAYRAALRRGVKMVAITHVSNILGVVNPVREMVREAHALGIPVLIDGAQGIVHRSVDVQALDCDFYAFSGHKIYAPTGIGVLYGKRAWLEKLPPFMGGGDMVEKVTFEKTTYADIPLKFEAGTSNFVGGACLAPALEFAASLASDGQVRLHEKAIMEAMDKALASVDGLFLAAGEAADRIPLYSFTIEGVHPLDAATLMDKMGVALRSGHMCAEPIVDRIAGGSMLRASLMPYNTAEEVEIFGAALQKVVKMLR